MFTVVETLMFEKQWPLYWSEDERGAFAAYIANVSHCRKRCARFGRRSKGPLAAARYW